ncbi:MAG: TRAP transporter large permease subunit [Gammaproteobacteria bacterium]
MTAPAESGTASTPASIAGKLRRAAIVTEDVTLSGLLAAMVLLPIAEILLRATLDVGIRGLIQMVQNLTLVAAMLGAAVAAREGRLLTFAAFGLLSKHARRRVTLLAGTVSVAVVSVLFHSGVEFAHAEWAVVDQLAFGFLSWLTIAALPLGYALILLRIVMRSTAVLTERLLTLVGGLALAAIWRYAPVDPQAWVVPGLIVIGLATIVGLPIFIVLGGVTLLLLASSGIPLASMAIDHLSLTSNALLPAIPMFTLAGYLLAESRAPTRLIEVFDALFGRYRGGAAVVTILTCSLFTCVTGASGVAVVALGALLLPLLRSSGYDERSAVALVTGGGLPGTILLPALPLVLYAIVANVGIREMFLGAVLPALLMLAALIGWGARRPLSTAGSQPPGIDRRRVLRAIWTAKWEIAVPAVAIGMLFSGLATPVEAAAVTAFYAFLVSTVMHRDLSLRHDLLRVMSHCGLLVGGILVILGTSLGLSNLLVDTQVPDRAVALVTAVVDNRWAFLFLLNIFLLLAGCVMDMYSAVIVMAPLVVPIGLAYGVHPVHLGVIFLANLELGYLTPPVGINLFYASARFNRPLLEVCHAVLPLIAALGASVLFITYVPFLSTALLRFLR